MNISQALKNRASSELDKYQSTLRKSIELDAAPILQSIIDLDVFDPYVSTWENEIDVCVRLSQASRQDKDDTYDRFMSLLSAVMDAAGITLLEKTPSGSLDKATVTIPVNGYRVGFHFYWDDMRAQPCHTYRVTQDVQMCGAPDASRYVKVEKLA